MLPVVPALLLVLPEPVLPELVLPLLVFAALVLPVLLLVPPVLALLLVPLWPVGLMTTPERPSELTSIITCEPSGAVARIRKDCGTTVTFLNPLVSSDCLIWCCVEDDTGAWGE